MRRRAPRRGLARTGGAPAALLLTALLAGLPSGLEASGLSAVEIGGEVTQASMAARDIEVRLFAEPERVGGADWLVPVVEVFHRGERVAREHSSVWDASFPARASLAQMDPANRTPEVVLESYTGGAHCCNEILVITKAAPGRWRTVEVGMFNGGPGFLEDASRDGRHAIVTVDNSFLYAFGCYACSAAPLQILAVEGGELRDLTFEPRYRERHREHLEKIEAALGAAGPAENGILAGWVAQKAILGEGAEAWAEMLARYDRDETWGLERCRDGGDACPEEEMVVRPFPEVLREFLHERGYRI